MAIYPWGHGCLHYKVAKVNQKLKFAFSCNSIGLLILFHSKGISSEDKVHLNSQRLIKSRQMFKEALLLTRKQI